MATVNDRNENSVNYLDVEEAARESLSVHWRAVFAGAFVSILVYMILMSLGLALGAGQVKDLIAGEDSVRAFGTGAGLWLLFSVLISLFVGSYASGRVSGIIATRVGYTQGLVITALFMSLMLTQAGMALGALTSSLSSGLGMIRESVSGATSQAASSPLLNSVVEDAVSDLQLKTNVQEVSTGVLNRLLRGDTNSAVHYLAAQSGISVEDAQARFNTISTQVRAKAVEIGNRAADSARNVGWAMFAVMMVGAIGSMLGGALGAQLNIRKPIDNLDRRALRTQKPAYT